MYQPSKINRLLCFGLICLLVTITNPPSSARAAGICALSAGQVVINEILPAATGGLDWVELYNTTNVALNLSNCYIDDVAGDKAPTQITAGNTIPAHGFWTLDRSSYFNNGGDDVRLLSENATTVLDSYTYPSSAADVAWYRSTDGGAWALAATSDQTKGASNSNPGVCGTGSWTAGSLEIHHIDIGQGDSTLIVSPTGKSLLFDAGESNWNSSAKARVIGPYVEAVLGCKQLDYVVISHFHLDHIGYVGYGGLWHLVESQNFVIGRTLLRNYNAYLGETSGTFDNWKTYLAGSGQDKLHPVTAIEGTGQVSLGGGVSFNIAVVDGNGVLIPGDFSAAATPPSENDYSIGALLSFGVFDEWLGGDLSGEYLSQFGSRYHDIELSAAPEIGDIDVYRVNHHGSDHSSSPTFLGQLDPEVSIISAGDGNTYGHPRQTVMDALLATSDVYLTERGDPTTNIGDSTVAGSIVIKTTNGANYTVNGVGYIATEPTRTDADGDGYFLEVDPGDTNPGLQPAARGGCDSLYQICFVKETATFLSGGAQDGWVLESSETSGLGSTLNAASATFLLGDNAAKKQYRGLLSFNTGAGLPDNAVITAVTLKVKKSAVVGGGNPVTIFQGFMVDIKKGLFGTASLQPGDFQVAASKSYGPFQPAPVINWYSIDLTDAKVYINKLSAASGLTQIRLRFKLDDNNNALANQLSLYSGNAPAAANRPQLVITYYAP